MNLTNAVLLIKQGTPIEHFDERNQKWLYSNIVAVEELVKSAKFRLAKGRVPLDYTYEQLCELGYTHIYTCYMIDNDMAKSENLKPLDGFSGAIDKARRVNNAIKRGHAFLDKESCRAFAEKLVEFAKSEF